MHKWCKCVRKTNTFHSTVYAYSLEPFQYVARQISMHDPYEAKGDTEALVALETAEKDSSDNETESEEDEVSMLTNDSDLE